MGPSLSWWRTSFSVKVIALAAVFCLLVAEHCIYAQAVEIPPELGTIDTIHQGALDKTIVYIQDAHDSLEAQQNIAKIIDYLVAEYGVRTVYEEGYEGEVPTDQYFGFIEEPEVREKVAFFLMDKLRIGGAEYAHINRQQDFRLVGADSVELHRENIEWYRKAAENKDDIVEDLEELHKKIGNLAHRYFPKELKAWMKLKKRFDDGQLDAVEYLKRMAKMGTVDLSAFPTIQLLLQAESSGDPELFKQIQNISAKDLFSEIEQFEHELSEQFLDSERDKQIFEYHRALSLLKKLNQIAISSTEYAAAKGILENISTQEMANFIAKHSKRSVVLSKAWETQIHNALRFYQTAEARDLAFKARLAEFIESHETIAGLVFGGFHKQNLQSIFKEHNLSFVIVTPKITEISEKHQDYYKQLMSLGRHPFEWSLTENPPPADSGPSST